MSLSHEIAPHLPFLRRYAPPAALHARNFPGQLLAMPAYVRATLEAILESPDRYHRVMHPRVALYRIFHVIWSGTRPGAGFLDRR